MRLALIAAAALALAGVAKPSQATIISGTWQASGSGVDPTTGAPDPIVLSATYSFDDTADTGGVLSN